MKGFFLPLALVLISGASAAFVKISIPAGTVIPVALHGSLSTKKSKVGQVVKARVMQDIPLGEGSKVRAGAYVQGKVIAVTPAGNGSGASITFEFTQLVMSRVAEPITTNLRALASIVEVNSARIPQYDDRGSSSYVNTTWQIGGETVYRGGGHVMDGKTDRWRTGGRGGRAWAREGQLGWDLPRGGGGRESGAGAVAVFVRCLRRVRV